MPLHPPLQSSVTHVVSSVSPTTSEAGQDAQVKPMFSVIIPTRDRPLLFRAALESVLAQVGASMEVVVINDGSAEAHQDMYAAIERDLGQDSGFPVTYIHLEHLPKGHGQSYALNKASGQASGRFLCFLDDDDTWTDVRHLARAQRLVADAPAVELMLFDQAAFRGTERVMRPIWLEDLGHRLKGQGAGSHGKAYRVDAETLLTAAGFSQVNATIVSVQLFRRIGGLNEGLFYEGDRDFYLRAVDDAGLILYCPEVMGRHNIPDVAKTVNMSTRAKPLERHMCQFILLNHVRHTARHRAIRDHAGRHRRFALAKALRAARTPQDYIRIGSIVSRSIIHEIGNRLRGSKTLPAGPQGV